MSDPKVFNYSNLSVAERILLAQELWDSVHETAQAIPLSEAQQQEIRWRWAAHEAGKMPTLSWAEMKQRILLS